MQLVEQEFEMYIFILVWTTQAVFVKKSETRMKIKQIGVKRDWRRELFFLKTYAKQTLTPKKLMGAWLLSWTLMWKIRGTSWTSRKTGQTAGLNWAKRTTERSLIKRWCASLLDCSHTPHLSTASTACQQILPCCIYLETGVFID